MFIISVLHRRHADQIVWPPGGQGCQTSGPTGAPESTLSIDRGSKSVAALEVTQNNFRNFVFAEHKKRATIRVREEENGRERERERDHDCIRSMYCLLYTSPSPRD